MMPLALLIQPNAGSIAIDFHRTGERDRTSTKARCPPPLGCSRKVCGSFAGISAFPVGHPLTVERVALKVTFRAQGRRFVKLGLASPILSIQLNPHPPATRPSSPSDTRSVLPTEALQQVSSLAQVGGAACRSPTPEPLLQAAQRRQLWAV